MHPKHLNKVNYFRSKQVKLTLYITTQIYVYSVTTTDYFFMYSFSIKAEIEMSKNSNFKKIKVQSTLDKKRVRNDC